MILEVAVNFPGRKIKVYAGHTHHAACYETANVQCFVGGAKYGYPKIESIIEVKSGVRHGSIASS
jgi:hypothetical protein